MIQSEPLSTAHRRACDALDLARERGDHHVFKRLRSATVHLWYALHSSDDTSERIAAAEDQLTSAIQNADDEIAASLRTVRNHLRATTGGDGA